MTQSALAISLAGLSFVLTVIWGPPLIRILRYFKVGKQIRVEGPERHFSKLGTPTMGGVMIILPVVLITLLLNAASLLGVKFAGRSTLLPLGVMICFGILGAIDDWEGLRGRRKGQGMRARTKFMIQVVIALIAGFGLWYFLDVPGVFLPGVPGEIEIGWWYVLLAAFIIVAESNAVNLTDGLDGLAGLISATAFAAYAVIALMQGQDYLARFCFILVGSVFGFLWFNVHPALLFMGDTGSLALGATFGTVALMTGQWPLLLLIGIMPLSITLSVILQIGYFKITGGRRLFKMTPLHHHFELCGWSETQVVQRFWLISLLGALIGVGVMFA
jgi:phospho-N-acetylmuramoyl-pentapeptide-transferase